MEASLENQLHMSWHDSAWLPVLNQHNVLDYFCQRSNPFYDRTCSNEQLKMQKQDFTQLQNMKGMEYVLIHVQEPILYIIRKNYRISPEKFTPVCNYYILDGKVYQCPDLKSVLNSRLSSALHQLDSAFDEVQSYARYQPAKGHYWEFPSDKEKQALTSKTKKKVVQEPSDSQCRRVETLLSKIIEKFPPRVLAKKEGGKPISVTELQSQQKGVSLGGNRRPPSKESESEAKRKKL